MKKEEAFSRLMEELDDCMGCPMRNFGTPVFSGNYMQEMMIIGYEPESHNVNINSDIVAKASKLLTLYENKVKYGAYITYLYRCSLHVHGEISDEGKENCEKFLKEEFNIIQPAFVLTYDERVIRKICDNPDKILYAKEYPVKASIFGLQTNIYYIK